MQITKLLIIVHLISFTFRMIFPGNKKKLNDSTILTRRNIFLAWRLIFIISFYSYTLKNCKRIINNIRFRGSYLINNFLTCIRMQDMCYFLLYNLIQLQSYNVKNSGLKLYNYMVRNRGQFFSL